MTTQGPQTRLLQDCLDRLRAGDEAARDELIAQSCERLLRLARKLKQDFPRVTRWQETGDVFQQAVMRLTRALNDIHPENVRAFIGLAAVQVRRELIDLVRSIDGPEGIGSNYESGFADGQNQPRHRREVVDLTDGPATLQLWTEFHQHIEQLPDDEREIFDLIYYQQLPQQDVAEILGVSLRTIKRRWRSAKVKLHDALNGESPGK